MTSGYSAEQSVSPPNAGEIARFLKALLSDGRLTLADVEILKAHARLNHRTGVNWQIAEAAAEGVKRQWREQLTSDVIRRVPQWDQAPTWHAVDCLQRWLGHALAQEFEFFRLQVSQRSDQTTRWWMALAETAEEVDGKCIGARLRQELADALNHL